MLDFAWVREATTLDMTRLMWRREESSARRAVVRASSVVLEEAGLVVVVEGRGFAVGLEGFVRGLEGWGKVEDVVGWLERGEAKKSSGSSSSLRFSSWGMVSEGGIVVDMLCVSKKETRCWCSWALVFTC